MVGYTSESIGMDPTASTFGALLDHERRFQRTRCFPEAIANRISELVMVDSTVIRELNPREVIQLEHREIGLSTLRAYGSPTSSTASISL